MNDEGGAWLTYAEAGDRLGVAADEAAKTSQAIAAFESLARRLEAIPAARRPWWQRLVG
jgi:hypothetical protein